MRSPINAYFVPMEGQTFLSVLTPAERCRYRQRLVRSAGFTPKAMSTFRLLRAVVKVSPPPTTPLSLIGVDLEGPLFFGVPTISASGWIMRTSKEARMRT